MVAGRPRLVCRALVAGWLAATAVRAYIPAVPTNDTSVIASSQDFIQLQWQALGSSTSGFFRDSLSRQLVADNSTQTGVDYAARGALVHFTEVNATSQAPTAAPWIAFVSCDSNGTDASQVDDIFTLARDHGAIAAVLFSKTAAACQINRNYLVNFEKPLDVYSTTAASSAQLIDSQFSNVGSPAMWFNSATLNASAPLIWQALNNSEVVVTPSNVVTSTSSSLAASSSALAVSTADGSGDDGDVPAATSTSLSQGTRPTFARRQATGSVRPVAPPTATINEPSSTTTPSSAAYLIAILANVNAQFVQPSSTASASTGGTSSGPSTGLAMIILYAITGIVTMLFLLVVLTGAVRAIRHPERYGPRRMVQRGEGGEHEYVGYQSRAGGLTRAILDTIPIVKFGARPSAPAPSRAALEHRESTYKLDAVELAGVKEMHYAEPSQDTLPHLSKHGRTPSAGSTSAAMAVAPEDGVDPALVDDSQQCPICVETFADGDDIRVLPCDERHRFHAVCLDPWLLDVSSLCPLCRSDVRDRVPAVTAPTETVPSVAPAAPVSRSRFARYVAQVRTARRRSSTTSSGSRPHFEPAWSHASPAMP